MKYIYLHGFASSPQSAKAQFFRRQLTALNLSLLTPDLNQDDFTHLTLSRQMAQVAPEIESAASVTLMGSSLGGLTAAWLGEQYPQVERLILLAPAFGFLQHWLAQLGPETVNTWQSSGYLPVFHPRAQRALPLAYGFVTDAQQYPEEKLQRSIPTLICHGRQDDVIPLQASEIYAQARPWVSLISLDSDHALTGALDQIWSHVQTACGL
ncbi:YqiA/YcfP family alpha/beta fold hydrolase [Synechocystis sp. LKSZ1]|uniref:YqiA/YcfP family alpha/beta fold hydrolase n=1 Tax=Synechocystis sp. LKSZ1 TaxID=3144951 RepID=UPI00336BF08E